LGEAGFEPTKVAPNYTTCSPFNDPNVPTDYVKPSNCKSLVEIQTAAIDVEDLNEAQWNDIPATDQVVSVDPISPPLDPIPAAD